MFGFNLLLLLVENFNIGACKFPSGQWGHTQSYASASQCVDDHVHMLCSRDQWKQSADRSTHAKALCRYRDQTVQGHRISLSLLPLKTCCARLPIYTSTVTRSGGFKDWIGIILALCHYCRCSLSVTNCMWCADIHVENTLWGLEVAQHLQFYSRENYVDACFWWNYCIFSATAHWGLAHTADDKSLLFYPSKKQMFFPGCLWPASTRWK